MGQPGKKVTFGELTVGDWYTAFPMDGDNSGHGGYIGPYKIFVKIPVQPPSFPGDLSSNTYSLADTCFSHNPDSMEVLQVYSVFTDLMRAKMRDDSQAFIRQLEAKKFA